MILPPGAIPSGRTNVLLALVDLERYMATVTVRDIATRLGISVSSVHWQSVTLRRDGFVTWEVGCAATLRSTVTVAARAAGSV